MDRYGKGARAERELLATFRSMGYSVIRSAGSGVNSISPDIIAMNKEIGFAFECKSWGSGSLSIEHEKFDELKLWEDNTGLKVYLAWKVSNDGWYFIRMGEMSRNEKSYSVTMRTTKQIGRRLEQIVPKSRETAKEQAVL